jgi:hypothetical protein
MATVAGSPGSAVGANQTAMKEVFGVGDGVFASWIAVDVLVANVWMAFLLYGAGRCRAHRRVDRGRRRPPSSA